MKQFLFLLLMATATGNTSYAQTSDEKAVTAVVESLRKAMVDPNKTILEKLTSPA